MGADSTSNPWDRGTITAASAFALLVAATLGLGVLPPVSAASERAGRTREIESKTAEAARFNDQAAELRRREASLREELARMNVVLEPASKVNQRVMLLIESAEKIGVRVGNVTPGAPSPRRDAVIVPISMSGTGGYESCAAFLDTLHATFPDMAVISFTAAARRAPDGRADAEFSIECEWRAAPAGAATGKPR